MWYALELGRAAFEPWRRAARAGFSLFDTPLNPWTYTPLWRAWAAALDDPAKPPSAAARLFAETLKQQSAVILPFPGTVRRSA